MLVKEIVTAQFMRGFAEMQWVDDDKNRRWILLSPVDADAKEILLQEGGDQPYMYQSLYAFSFDVLPPAKIVSDDIKTTILTDLFIDIDSPSLEYAHSDAKNFVRHLCAAYDLEPTNMRYYFSGAKGFHLEIPTGLFSDGDYLIEPDARVLNETVRSFVNHISYGFDSIDKSIYDLRRIIRIPGAVNPHSGLRKIELEYGELIGCSIAEIKHMAGSNREYKLDLVPDVKKSDLLHRAWMNSIVIHHKINPPRSTSSFRDIFLAKVKTGNRNHSLASLTGLLRKRDIELDIAQMIAKLWNNTNCDTPLDDDEVSDTVYRLYTRYKA